MPSREELPGRALPVVAYAGIARAHTSKDVEAIGGVSAQLFSRLVATAQCDGHYRHFGLTAPVPSRDA